MAGVRRHGRADARLEAKSAGCATGSPPRSGASRDRPTSVEEALETGVEALVRAAADAAAERTARPGGPARAGAALLGDGGILTAARVVSRPDRTRGARSATGRGSCSISSATQGRASGRPPVPVLRRQRRRRSSLMIVVFAHTGGLTGARSASRGGSHGPGPEAARGALRRPGGARPSPQRPATTSAERVATLLDDEARSLSRRPGRTGLRSTQGAPGMTPPAAVRGRRRTERGRSRGEHRWRRDIAGRLEALAGAVTVRDGRTPGRPGRSTTARALVARAGERLRLSGEHTVVALAGATGSGKSSLFNALAGLDLSAVGVRRPTTSTPHACVWGGEGAAPLLDWLGVAAPARRSPATAELDGPARDDLDGLVLLDLPDHDSTRVDHRLEVDRLVELVDLLVWVVDPQKYADAPLHERYLRRLARHAADDHGRAEPGRPLDASRSSRCVADLARLLVEDGLRRLPVLASVRPHRPGIDGPAHAARRRGDGTGRAISAGCELAATCSTARRSRSARQQSSGSSSPKCWTSAGTDRAGRGADGVRRECRGRRGGRACLPRSRRPGRPDGP